MIDLSKPDFLLCDWLQLSRLSAIIHARSLGGSGLPQCPLIMIGPEDPGAADASECAAAQAPLPTTEGHPVGWLSSLNVLSDAASLASDVRLIDGDVDLNATAHLVRRSGRPIHLGPTEFRLLWTLVERRNRAMSREELLDHVWGTSAQVSPRTVDVHILRLRKALTRGGESDVIRTIRGVGYAYFGETASAPRAAGDLKDET
ncbi:MAG: winged helix-turn-helix domain-containing protein [Rhodospirillales bacterium]|nr:winged helix-turn-helix domain-containing protein [Rhodospirillales bacterium]